jgi:hypothetical protein
LAEGALAVPVGGKVLSGVLTQVFDLRGGMFMVDLSVFVTGTNVEAWIFRAVARIGSLTAIEGLLVRPLLSSHLSKSGPIALDPKLRLLMIRGRRPMLQ